MIFELKELLSKLRDGVTRAFNVKGEVRVDGPDYVGRSTDTKPTVGVEDKETYLEVDTGKAFIFYDGEWWEL